MIPTDALAAFAAGLTLDGFPAERRDRLALHVFDSLGAALAGRDVAETRELHALVASEAFGSGPAPAAGTTLRTSVGAAALLGVAGARCTEIDDIHRPGCITPGSVIVPVALAVAGVTEPDGATFLAACAAGLEVLVRFGLAVDGARILYRGIWPTYLCAGFGAAVTAARLLGLDAAGIGDALGIAATLATGTTGRPPAKTSRWLTIGAAAQNGVLAALAAARGLRGDVRLLGAPWSESTGIALDVDPLIAELGERFELDAISFKPWCTAKQAVAATEAFRILVAEHGLDPATLERVEVRVPAAYRAMIDRAALPTNRIESFVSVQYQCALAAFAPTRAYDAARDRIEETPEVRRLMERTHVIADASLDALYPAAWPAAVTVVAAGGRAYRHELRAAPGDPGTPFGWHEVRTKLARSTGAAPEALDALAAEARGLAGAADVRGLLAAAERAAM